MKLIKNKHYIFVATSIVGIAMLLFHQQGFVESANAEVNQYDSKYQVDKLIASSEKLIDLNIDSSLYYAQLAQQKAFVMEYSEGQIKALHALSNIYLKKNDYFKALSFAEQALKKSDEIGNTSLIGISKMFIAVIYSSGGFYEKSIKSNFESLEIFEELRDSLRIGIVYGNIGSDYVEQKNFEKAIEYLNKSLDIAISLNDTVGMAYQFNNIGIIYLTHFKEYDKSYYYFKEALNINLKTNSLYLQGINYINIGTYYSYNQEYDSAYGCYSTALSIFSKLNSNEMIANTYFSIATLYYDRKDYINATIYAKKSFDIAAENRYLEFIKSSSELLHKSYIELKDTILAYKYLNIENMAKDSLAAIQNQREIARIEFQYQIERDLKQDEIKQTRRTLIAVSVFSFLGLVILFVVVLYYRQKIKADRIVFENSKIQSELDYKSKEITVNLLSIGKVMDSISQTIKRLEEIKQQTSDTRTKNSISMLVEELMANSEGKLEQDLSLRFNEVNKDFYDHLTDRFPNLTPSDLKLCAFLRLNMTSKDISLITGQRVETIEAARYRLRKRLGIINSETNLVLFLSQF
jgi:tetratricopeptide (TPR) repeat protein